MGEKRTLLIVCAMGYATSTIIKKAIAGYFNSHQIVNWQIETTALNMSRGLVEHADLIVSSLELQQDAFDIPIVNGVSLISGIGQEQVLKEIHEHIKRIEESDTRNT